MSNPMDNFTKHSYCGNDFYAGEHSYRHRHYRISCYGLHRQSRYCFSTPYPQTVYVQSCHDSYRRVFLDSQKPVLRSQQSACKHRRLIRITRHLVTSLVGYERNALVQSTKNTESVPDMTARGIKNRITSAMKPKRKIISCTKWKNLSNGKLLTLFLSAKWQWKPRTKVTRSLPTASTAQQKRSWNVPSTFDSD